MQHYTITAKVNGKSIKWEHTSSKTRMQVIEIFEGKCVNNLGAFPTNVQVASKTVYTQMLDKNGQQI